MLGFEWDALRVGDRVLVHGTTNVIGDLVPGAVVTIILQEGSNGVGMRILSSGGDPSIVWPSRLTVHHDPQDPLEPCWRCKTVMAVAA
jgi:hypothetical protein